MACPIPASRILRAPLPERLRGTLQPSFVRRNPRYQTWVLLVALTLPTRAALATDSEPAATQTEARLPALPVVTKLDPVRPEPAEVEEFEAKLQALFASSQDEREQAARELLELRPRLVHAALARFDKLSERADRDRLKRALSNAKERKHRSKTSGPTDAATSDDLLQVLLAQPTTKDAAYRDVVELVALVRIFAQIGTVEAARGLVDVYARFGEFMRVDVQNRLFELKDGAVAALLEARRHKAEKIANWAERQLDRLGKAAPGEAIRTENYENLADILRAYGRTKDPDAARIVVSYANSERYQVREAARQGVVLMGEVGLWQLREAYEDVVGKRPRRDWSWDRTARELFYEYDRLHVAAVQGLFETGRKAHLAGDFHAMAKAYDAVLARSPVFESAPEMAQGYFAFAQKVQQQAPELARTALVRVERLTTDPSLRARAQSLRATLEATSRLSAGVFDAHLLQTAVDRDATNQKARKLLQTFDEKEVEALTHRVRWLTSGAIALVSLIAIILVLARRNPRARGDRTQAESRPVPSAPSRDAHPDEPADSPREDHRVTAEVPAAAHPSPAAESNDAPAERAEPTRRDPFEGL